MKIKTLRQTWTERTNKRTKISLSLAPVGAKKNIKRQEVLFHENSKRIIDMNLLLEHESSREMTLLIF